MLNGFGHLRHFDANVSDDGGNLAALGNVLDGVASAEQGFHNFHDRRTDIILGAKTDYRAATMQNVADQLKRSSAHKAL